MIESIPEILHSIEFQMSLLLFLALAGYLIASRINQSAVVGEIIVGLIVGPSLLGLITYTDFVKSIATLGAIILLFVVGLEFKLQDIFEIKYSVIAFFGVLIPWIGGFLITIVFGFPLNSGIFVATALTATSIAITANVLKEMGKLKTDAAKAIIGAAVIDDVLSLIILSVSQQVVFGSFSYGKLLSVIFYSVSFLVIGLYVGHKYMNRFVQKLDATKISQKFPEIIFIFAMMIAFGYAMIAELIGLSAIVGAFIAGVSLENAVIKYGKNYRDGAEYMHIIFASVFFISLGIIADFHALNNIGLIVFAIALTLVAIITKYVGCFIPAKLYGLSKTDATIVGIGMSPRGEVAMIVALIGLNEGFIGQDLYVALVLMSLLTTLVAPLIIRNWLYKNGTETNSRIYS